MRHRRLGAYAGGAWAVAVAVALAANDVSAYRWLLPIAAMATLALAVRALRWLAWALPIAALASVDPAADWPRAAAALVAVLAAIGAVGLLDAWSESGYSRWEMGTPDPADLASWRASRRGGAIRLGTVTLVVAAGWVALGAVDWSAPGWLVALTPLAAVVAVAGALWPQWRPVRPARPTDR